MKTTSAVLLSLALTSVLASPLDPAKSMIEGFYTTYSGQDFSASNCLTSTQQTQLIDAAEVIYEDFADSHSFSTLAWDVAKLLDDLQGVQTACGLTTVNQNIVEYVKKVGVAGLAATIQENVGSLAALGFKMTEDVLQHDWYSVGVELGAATLIVIPPANEELFAVGNVNFFQKLDNFTAGFFYGLATNPKKPVACFNTYNETAIFFRNASSVIEGCVHLYMNDCQRVRDLVPNAIIELQGLVLSCKLEDLWQSLKNLADPTFWSQIVVTYYWNMATITGLVSDFLQSYMLKNWRQMGVDMGSVIRIIFNFRLN